MSHSKLQTTADSIDFSKECFRNSMEHLLAELERVDLLIQQVLQKVEKIFSNSDSYRGLYITGSDTKTLLRKPIGEPWWSVLPSTLNESGSWKSMDAILQKIEYKKSDLLRIKSIVRCLSKQ